MWTCNEKLPDGTECPNSIPYGGRKVISRISGKENRSYICADCDRRQQEQFRLQREKIEKRRKLMAPVWFVLDVLGIYYAIYGLIWIIHYFWRRA
jgi:hypothetical protein